MATMEEIKYIAEQARSAIDYQKQVAEAIDMVAGNLGHGGRNEIDAGGADTVLRQLTGQRDRSNPESVRGAILDRQYAVDQQLLVIITAARSQLADSGTLERQVLEEIISQAEDARKRNMEVGTRATEIADQALTKLNEFDMILGNMAQIARETGSRPPQWAQLSDRDKEFLQEINPEAYAYFESLPEPTAQNAGTGNKITPPSLEGGAGLAENKQSGSGNAPVTPPPPPKVTVPTVGSFNGRPIYDPSVIAGPGSQDILANANNPDGYTIEMGLGGIQFIPAGQPTAEPGTVSNMGYAFSYDALREGSVDLDQFSGPIRDALLEDQKKLQEEQAARDATMVQYGTDFLTPEEAAKRKERKQADQRAGRTTFPLADTPVEQLVAPIINEMKGTGISRSRQV